MKLRNPWLIRSAGLLGAGAVQLWMGTLRFRLARPALAGAPAEHVYPADPRSKRFLYAVWHESILSAAALRLRAHTLISHHADGELIAQICRHLGIGVVRGSPKAGAIEGLRKLCRVSERTHLALTPDGPRGPRYVIQPGVIAVAQLTGLPIVPLTSTSNPASPSNASRSGKNWRTKFTGLRGRRAFAVIGVSSGNFLARAIFGISNGMFAFSSNG